MVVALYVMVVALSHNSNHIRIKAQGFGNAGYLEILSETLDVRVMFQGLCFF